MIVLTKCITVCFALLVLSSAYGMHTYSLTFEEPMSWAGDAVPWGLGATQTWEIADGGKSGKGLRVSAAINKEPFSNETRTIQINHRPGASAKIEFDIKANSLPKGSALTVRHFDGYCTGDAIARIADEKFKPFPKPLWESDKAGVSKAWKHVAVETGPLKNTILTLAITVRQNPPKEGETVTEFVDFMLDNLTIKTESLDKLMDPGFDWHGKGGNATSDLRFNTNAADSDWCDYSEQKTYRYWNGKDINFTLFQLRDASSYSTPYYRHNVVRDVSADDIGGYSVIALKRSNAGQSSAACWGIRQTVAYSAFGVKPGEKAKFRVTMKMANDEPGLDFSRVQLGVDPMGGIIPDKAKWTEESLTILSKKGWDYAELEFEQPKDSQAVTIYFRHLDGLPGGPTNPPPYPEVESRGSPYGCSAYADWVTVERMVNGSWSMVNVSQ